MKLKFNSAYDEKRKKGYEVEIDKIKYELSAAGWGAASVTGQDVLAELKAMPIPAEVSDVVKAAIVQSAAVGAFYATENSSAAPMDNAQVELDLFVHRLLSSPHGAAWRVSEKDGEDGR